MTAPTPATEREYDERQDSHDSYYEAVRAIAERVRAGEPVPACMLPLSRDKTK